MNTLQQCTATSSTRLFPVCGKAKATLWGCAHNIMISKSTGIMRAAVLLFTIERFAVRHSYCVLNQPFFNGLHTLDNLYTGAVLPVISCSPLHTRYHLQKKCTVILTQRILKRGAGQEWKASNKRIKASSIYFTLYIAAL